MSDKAKLDEEVLSPPARQQQRPGGISRYRWQVVALLFFATTINYLDR